MHLIAVFAFLKMKIIYRLKYLVEASKYSHPLYSIQTRNYTFRLDTLDTCFLAIIAY